MVDQVTEPVGKPGGKPGDRKTWGQKTWGQTGRSWIFDSNWESPSNKGSAIVACVRASSKLLVEMRGQTELAPIVCANTET